MKGFRPLKDSSRSPLSRALLDAARRDGLPEGARGRALVALGLGTGVTAAGAAATTVAKASTLVLGKWFAIGALGAVTAAVSAGYVVHRTLATDESVRRPEVVTAVGAGRSARAAPASWTEMAAAPVRSASAAPPLPASPPVYAAPPDVPPFAAAVSSAQPLSPAPAEPGARVVTAEPARPRGTRVAVDRVPHGVATQADVQPETAPETLSAPADQRPDSLSMQLGALSRVRAALAARDPSRALDLLAAFERRNPSSSLAEEATVLRVEALACTGRVTEARALGEAFAGSHAASPYLERVREAIHSP